MEEVKAKLILQENDNEIKISIGGIDITDLILNYEFYRDYQDKYLKITIPISETKINLKSS